MVQVQNVKVGFTGMPGHSLVRWKRVTNANAYVVQRSRDPKRLNQQLQQTALGSLLFNLLLAIGFVLA